MNRRAEYRVDRTPRSSNAIDLFLLSAGLPWATGFRFVRQSKHWGVAQQTTRELLELCVAEKRNGSVANIARKELQGFEESWIKFALYMFPEADAEKVKLLAASMVYIFIFDGKSTCG